MTAIIVHGGCGIWLPSAESDAKAGTAQAAQAAQQILLNGGTALQAVITACTTLENNPTFNAGTGSVLNYDGIAQMDASLMEGHTCRFGAVAAIERVQNPILVAQKIIETTDHNILAGTGATTFAHQNGFPDYDPRTPKRIAEHNQLLAKVPKEIRSTPLKTSQYSTDHPEHAHLTGSLTTGTIGAVALDSHGHLAAATSTGGILLKLSGRVGDTALPGCGTYATNYSAVSSTGTGEFVMRILGARQVCDLIDNGQTPQQAIGTVLNQIQTTFSAQTGLIALNHTGKVGIAHRTPEMPHAFAVGNEAITARIRA
ncbi:MAG: isoaspartyl peptidase/L-asparaginase family protein [Phormidesmis sp.]